MTRLGVRGIEFEEIRLLKESGKSTVHIVREGVLALATEEGKE